MPAKLREKECMKTRSFTDWPKIREDRKRSFTDGVGVPAVYSTGSLRWHVIGRHFDLFQSETPSKMTSVTFINSIFDRRLF